MTSSRRVRVWVADVEIHASASTPPDQRQHQQDLVMRILDELDARTDVVDAEINGTLDGPLNVHVAVPTALTPAQAAEIAVTAIKESIHGAGGLTAGWPEEGHFEDVEPGVGVDVDEPLSQPGSFTLGVTSQRRELIDA